ncbi:MAG: DUF1552 domain-containing protein [Nannocystaceae bacterium]|nr:DUF1552 domain-containing protein [Nannocystaceae bacterium]
MAIKSLHRRTFLRGLGGIAVGLPVLEIMLDRHGRALAGGGAMAKHFFVGFHGQAMGGDGDPEQDRYRPDTLGPNYDLKQATMPLGNYNDVRQQVSIISNLRIPYNNSGPGSWNTEFHLGAMPPLLCGVSNPDDSSACRGITADQVVANAIGAGTKFATGLQYNVQPSWYLTDSAPYGRDVISYKSDGAGGVVPNPGQTSPQAAFMALFQGFVPPDPTDALAAQRELARRKSVLDLVHGDIDRLMPRLSAADKIRMQRHLDEIRDLENRLAAIPPDAGGECMMYADPGADPPIGGNNAGTGGDGFDTNAGYSDEDTRARRFSDLVHMAFVCDLSRSVAMQYTMAQSHMSAFPFTGIPYDQHEVGHSVGTTDAVSQILAWQLDQFAYLVAKLRDTPEGAGSVLDNTAMVLLYEGGHGLDPATGDPNRTHSTENMIVTVAGRAGGMLAGHHLDGGGLHPVNVLNTAMRAVGVDEDLGEVVGIVPELLP